MFNARFDGGACFSAKFSGNVNLRAQLSETILKPIGDYYAGEYEWTPGDMEKAIPIAGLIATRDIKIKPVPSNYGRITWDGSTITVS